MKHHSRLSLAIGFLLHLFISYNALIKFELSQIIEIKQILLLSSICLAIITIVIEIWHNEIYLSIFTLPACVVTILSSSIIYGALHGSQFDNPLFFLHLITAIAGECFFIIAAISSISYLYVVRRLKKKNKMKAVLILPPLARLDQLTSKLILSGVIFFTIGILAGTYQSLSDYNILELGLKQALSFIVIAFYMAILILKKPLKLAGINQAKLVIIGMLLSLCLIIIPNNKNHWAPENRSVKELTK